MSQKENRRQQIEKVLSVSKRLFITQGYEKTTMRQIIDAAEMTTGSLYNFFSSKEEILLQLIRDLFTDVPELADQIVSPDENPLLRISMELSMYLYAAEFAPNLTGLYISTFKSYPAARLIAHIEAKRAMEIVAPLLGNNNYMDYYLRNIAIVGIMEKILEEREYGDMIFQFEQTISFLCRYLILIYELPVESVDEIVEQTLDKFRQPEVHQKIRELMDFWLDSALPTCPS